MARWQDVVSADAAFAEQVKARFDAHKHKLLATLRKDGSPRLSGIETTFADGDVWLGMMPGSMKARDLERDPRFALHTSSVDPPEGDESGWLGDAKLAGTAVSVTDADTRRRVHGDGAAGHAVDAIPTFRLDLHEVVLIRVGTPADHLVIDVWRDGEGRRSLRRA